MNCIPNIKIQTHEKHTILYSHATFNAIRTNY